MEKIDIRDVDTENIDDLISLCIPAEKKGNKLFIEGGKIKKKWAECVMERYGKFAKLAYLNGKLAGMIQYLPHTDEKVIEIQCIFVPEQENLRKGVGRMLVNSLIEDMRKPKPYFGNDIPRALVAWAFQVPGRYPQHEFYKKMGFKQVNDDPFLVYYPLIENYVYTQKSKEYIPQDEDLGAAFIFYKPSCPFCMYFSEKIKENLREVAPDIPLRMINQFEDAEEVEKRGKVSFCIVNGRPITSFFMDKENFQKEVREALGKK